MDLAGPLLPQPNRKITNRDAHDRPQCSQCSPPKFEILGARHPASISKLIRKVAPERPMFGWCQELISVVTVHSMMLGSKVAQDETLLQRFVDLFNESDPERGFASPMNAFATISEVTIRGSRRAPSLYTSS
jgi:hypothetical protein